jgi:hypothetical protein
MSPKGVARTKWIAKPDDVGSMREKKQVNAVSSAEKVSPRIAQRSRSAKKAHALMCSV